MKARFKQFVAMVTVLVLVLSFLPPALADSGDGMTNATLLTPGEAVEFTTDTDPVNTYWFKMERETSAMTHMEVTFESSKLANISIYPSTDMAAKDETFDRYRASASPDAETSVAKIHFPYAWEGPYYIKVEYMPLETIDEEGAVIPPTAADVSLGYKSVKLPVKYEEGNGTMCPVESLLPMPEDGGLLDMIRRLQEEILGGSKEGRQLEALYYKSSPYLVRKLAFDKQKRQEALTDLQTLRPLITSIVNKESHTITKNEAAAINRMHALVKSSVPSGIKSDVNDLASSVDMTRLAGSTVEDVFAQIGMELQTVDTPRYIVKYKSQPSTSIGKMNAMTDVSAERISIGRPGDYFALVDVESANTKMQAKAKATLSADSNVEFIEPVQTYKAFATDSNYEYQWAINEKSVLQPMKYAGVGLEGYEALRLPGRSIKVAVLDTGVDDRLLDFKGKVDVANGKDFTDPNGDGSSRDENGHGTHVAGVIGAVRDNGVSMRGMVPNVSILPVKVLGADGTGDTDQIALGIKYAVDAGAKVINMSLGGSESRTIGYMLKYAYDRGVVVVAATGNESEPEVSYPASSKYTISVGATNSLGIVADYSNFGYGVDVVAPGSKIASLVPDGNVVYLDGTSMATPHVAGVVALLKSQHPTLSVESIRALLQRTADPVAFSGGDVPEVPVDEEDEWAYEDMSVEFSLPVAYYDVLGGFGKVNLHHAESMLKLNASGARAQDNATAFKAKVASGTSVRVYKGEKLIGRGTSKQTMAAFSIQPQKAGTLLRVVYTNGKYETSERVIVKAGTRPGQPKVNTLRSGAKSVTGRGDAGMRVVVRNSKYQLLGRGTVLPNGTFSVKTRALKKSETINVHIEDLKGRPGKMTKTTVR
ncbi:S8 family peptidase [Exiguobacterium qingdaonense]|uniref:S8 family peptidase n=1 Tax=Exiguobacterium qingdaonense TaxID=2751251 RepID=UPI001BE65C03|nr:S8 family peptidase [Exiguobacterium qingdaonense]